MIFPAISMSMGFSMIFHDFPICSMNRWDNSMGFSAPVAQDLQLLHHHEPRLRGPRRAAGQLEGAWHLRRLERCPFETIFWVRNGGLMGFNQQKWWF